MSYSYCLTHNVSLKMAPSKCVTKNISLKMFQSKCLTQNISLKVSRLYLSHSKCLISYISFKIIIVLPNCFTQSVSIKMSQTIVSQNVSLKMRLFKGNFEECVRQGSCYDAIKHNWALGRDSSKRDCGLHV